MSQNPHDLPPNGAGGEAGTHEGHADNVPTFGLGMDDGGAKIGRGNRASKQREHEVWGTDAYGTPFGSGLAPGTVAN